MISAALHLTLAALAYCLLAGDIAPLDVAFALLLGLAPDFDTPKSLVGSLACSISVPLERRVGHRTATHSLLDLLIGVQGVRLFWPMQQFLTLTAWRDDGPMPRVLLPLAAPALPVARADPSWRRPAAPAVTAAAAVANPIATPHPSPTPPAPPIGPVNPLVAPAPLAAAGEVAEQPAERAALIAEQRREAEALARHLAGAQRALGAIQARHEREQQEHAHAVERAGRALDDAHAAQMLADPADIAAVQRAAERTHAAEAKLIEILDAQDRMRTDQGIERAAAEAELAAAQADLAALPGRQQAALDRLDADHAAARLLAEGRLRLARAHAGEAAQAHELEERRAAATAQALAVAHQGQVTATVIAHAAASTATAQAQPTPMPTNVISHAAGTIAAIGAEERDGRLTITIDLIPAH